MPLPLGPASEDAPGTCSNTMILSFHPALMFNRKTVELFAKIERSIGPEKIYSACLVNATVTDCARYRMYKRCAKYLFTSNIKKWTRDSISQLL